MGSNNVYNILAKLLKEDRRFVRYNKWTDNDLILPLLALKRFQLYGSERIYSAGPNRSINGCFKNDKNLRLWKIGQPLFSLNHFGHILSNNDLDNDKRNKILEDIKNILTQNASNATIAANPFILAYLCGFTVFRPILVSLFPVLILKSRDLFIFHYYKKKGRITAIRKAIYQWYQEHSRDKELVKDLLLVRKRMGWSHLDVIRIWHLPVKEDDIIMRILINKEINLLNIQDNDMKEIVTKCVKVRSIVTRNELIEILNNDEYIKELGDELISNIRTQFIDDISYGLMIPKIELNTVIESIPKILNRYPNSQNLSQQLLERFNKLEKTTNLNCMSLLLIYKWFEHRLKVPATSHKQKMIYKIISDRIYNLLDDVKVHTQDKILFLFNFNNTKEEKPTAENETNNKKSKLQEINRPFVCFKIVKQIEFLAFLLHQYPNHVVLYDEEHMDNYSKDKFHEIVEKLKKHEENKNDPEAMIKKIANYKVSIYVKMDEDIPNTFWEQITNIKNKIIVLFATKKNTPHNIYSKNLSENVLIINGLDTNLFTVINKHLNCF